MKQGASGGVRIPARLACGVLVAIAAALGITSYNSGRAFDIGVAGWSERRDKLTLGGNADAGASVVVRYAVDGAVLATTVADRRGHWSIRLSGPQPVPCRVRAEAGDSTDERRVATAPADCSAAGGQRASTSVSINSTSVNRDRRPGPAVSEQPWVTLQGYQILAHNDLGMHCTDSDHRVITILPPVDNPRIQVLRRGKGPDLLGPELVEVVYSAASSPRDPALVRAPTERVYKINSWDENPRSGRSNAVDAFGRLYPPGLLERFALTPDRGLPFPEVARLHLGDGDPAPAQSPMPGLNLPYVANDPQPVGRFVEDFPLFLNFPFGYLSRGLDAFVAEGVPITPFDDAGRRNPYPLMRIQARDRTGLLTGEAGRVIASLDTVLPASDETRCERCHGDPQDGGTPGRAADAAFGGSPWSKTRFEVSTAFDDPRYGELPLEVSVEWAVDRNILRLHDARHGANYRTGPCNADDTGDPDCLINRTPIACQVCHYSPALDLAQQGPSNANGLEQGYNVTLSRALHGFHGRLQLPDGRRLLPDMPPADDPRRTGVDGNPVINGFVEERLQETCYNCHPGRITRCLRGAMYRGGLVCQDCHGQPRQIGDDFSRGVSFDNPGAFELGNDFYTNPATPRVPWANEPGCGSCHTGDALDNLAGSPGTIESPKGIRLLRAFRRDDPKATPIVPTNKRFAEPTVAVNDPSTRARAGNPMLYRLSTGHGGLLCGNCHGATHAIYPVGPVDGPWLANDNAAAMQLQGHVGTIVECRTCHGDALYYSNTLQGPHGMHPVGNTRFADSGHARVAEHEPAACAACHGADGEGTVLSTTHADRDLVEVGAVARGTRIGCGLCHDNPYASNGPSASAPLRAKMEGNGPPDHRDE